MTTFVSELEPQALWRHFDQILTIPRASKDEGRMRDYVVSVAERNGLEHHADAAGNVVVRKPGTAGREDAPITILQGHMDMVQEKNSDVDFDFSSDAIVPRRDGEYLNATGTTLGSDNGIGLAAMLALMDDEGDVEHGPLELLFTIDEETGLTGAAQLDASLLEGRRLINMDSEDEGVLCVGCAGGADTTLRLPLSSTATPEGAAALGLKLTGLKGGHSGIDIALQRGNAIQLLARALHAVAREHPIRLASFAGGTAHNAIPREAFATVVVDATDRDGIAAALEAEEAAIARELKTVEPDLDLSIQAAEAPGDCWDEASSQAVMRLLTALPHGIETMSYDIPGLVETSTNLATAGGNGELVVTTSTRSSVASALEALRGRIRATAELAGAAAEEHEGYPGWQPDMESGLLRVVQELHERELGVEPKVEAVHAGLECGLIGEMIPGMDMISFGPQIEFPHSPDERVKIDSVGRFWRLLTATLGELAG